MTEPILHHYDISPFSEKVRLIFGLKGVRWASVIIPQIMPKPDYTALTGGYRRTPSLQVGADIYCDTRLIAEELERRYPLPTLFPGAAEGLHRAIEAWAESTLFWPAARATVGVNAAHMLPEFHADRAAMRGLPPPTPDKVRAAGLLAEAQLPPQIAWLTGMLADGRDYLLGDRPGLADFAVYHCLWFLDRLPHKLGPELITAKAVTDWMTRIAAIGHGEREEIEAAEAIAAAHASQPEAPPPSTDPTLKPGQQVTVEPEERTSAAVQGEIVFASPTRITLRRTDDRAGTVHVHFPRLGYVVKPA